MQAAFRKNHFQESTRWSLIISRDCGPRRRISRCPSALKVAKPWFFDAGLDVCLVSTGPVRVSAPALSWCGPTATSPSSICGPFMCLRLIPQIGCSCSLQHPSVVALLQLLRRSAAYIVRENTDREMATFLMVSIQLPYPDVQALFIERHRRSLEGSVIPGRNCCRISRKGSTSLCMREEIASPSLWEQKTSMACLGPIFFYAVKASDERG